MSGSTMIATKASTGPASEPEAPEQPAPQVFFLNPSCSRMLRIDDEAWKIIDITPLTHQDLAQTYEKVGQGKLAFARELGAEFLDWMRGTYEDVEWSLFAVTFQHGEAQRCPMGLLDNLHKINTTKAFGFAVEVPQDFRATEFKLRWH